MAFTPSSSRAEGPANYIFLQNARGRETLKHCPGSKFQEAWLVCSFLYTTFEEETPYPQGKPLHWFPPCFESLASRSRLYSFI